MAVAFPPKPYTVRMQELRQIRLTGVEPTTAAILAQRAAKPLQAPKAQKDLDALPLFNDQAKQKELF